MIMLLREHEPLIVVVEDDRGLSDAIHEICDHLDVTVQHLSSEEDFAPMLARHRPMAVVAKIEANGQDSYHVMKIVANHDRNLPIVLLTGGDPAPIGAADAVQNLAVSLQGTLSHEMKYDACGSAPIRRVGEAPRRRNHRVVPWRSPLCACTSLKHLVTVPI